MSDVMSSETRLAMVYQPRHPALIRDAHLRAAQRDRADALAYPAQAAEWIALAEAEERYAWAAQARVKAMAALGLGDPWGTAHLTESERQACGA
jgi:hypothetical protein